MFRGGGSLEPHPEIFSLTLRTRMFKIGPALVVLPEHSNAGTTRATPRSAHGNTQLADKNEGHLAEPK